MKRACKVISVRQPWADALVSGMGGERKPVENRTWWTPHRGPLLIHAGQRYDYEGAKWILSTFGVMPPSCASLERRGRMGAILGGVLLTDCVDAHDSRWFSGPYGFVCDSPAVLGEPVPYAGHLAILDFEARRLGSGPRREHWRRAIRELNANLWRCWQPARVRLGAA